MIIALLVVVRLLVPFSSIFIAVAVVDGTSIEHIDENEVSFLLTDTFETLLIETVDLARVNSGLVRAGGVFGGEINAETSEIVDGGFGIGAKRIVV